MGFLSLLNLSTPWGWARHTYGLDGAVFGVQPAPDTAKSILVGHLDTTMEGVALSLVLIPVRSKQAPHTKGSTLELMRLRCTSPEDVVERNASKLHVVPERFLVLGWTHLGEPVLDVPIRPIVLESEFLVAGREYLLQFRHQVGRATDGANSGSTVGVEQPLHQGEQSICNLCVRVPTQE